jgi:hypothetical protein
MSVNADFCKIEIIAVIFVKYSLFRFSFFIAIFYFVAKNEYDVEFLVSKIGQDINLV